MTERDSWLAVALAVLAALAVTAVWPAAPHLVAFAVNPLLAWGLP